jgi:methylmalonyl-CoA mutase N-terminal domain/subunit
MGGTQSLHTNSMDEALWLPTEKSVRTALRTQQIIAYESGVADTIDPMAGSYVIEYMTDEICKRAMEYITRIDGLGGALSAIEKGYMQNEIQDSAYKFQKDVESKQQVVVGVNSFQVEEKRDLERLKMDPAIEKNQVAKLAELRKNRDNVKAIELMTQLDAAARGTDNLMPLLVTCMENDLTLGEVCGVLRTVWGEYQPPVWG